MAGGVILENLSGKKLFVLVSSLLFCQLACFLIGGLVAPTPSSTDMVLASKCLYNHSNPWSYIRGEGKCFSYHSDMYKDTPVANMIGNNIIFTFQIPTPRDGQTLDYSRWQQNLIGVLNFDFEYHSDSKMDRNLELTLDTKLGYRNVGDKDGDWKLFATSVEKRNLDCVLPEEKIDGHNYQCGLVPLFELGSLHHDYYLINIKIPDEENGINFGLGHLKDVWLVVINQNGGFTQVWLYMKTIFFPFIVAIMIWFWNRVHMLARKPVLLERMLMTIGFALTLLNLPVEFLTLSYDMPFMLLLQDIRQGIFYAALLSFWLIFAGEHLMIQDSQQKNLQTYWKHLSAVAVGCISLLVFDICERGAQLKSPFYSLWATNTGTNLALTFIILAAMSGGTYFLFLSYMIWKVFCNISARRSALPSMSNARRLHYEGSIYRFKFLMIATLLCAALTVIGFILGQATEGHWKWSETYNLNYASAFLIGVYGMWNIYIFALIVLYSPSHKHWPSEIDVNNSSSDTIEFSRLPTEPTELSSLASFSRKSAFD